SGGGVCSGIRGVLGRLVAEPGEPGGGQVGVVVAAGDGRVVEGGRRDAPRQDPARRALLRHRTVAAGGKGVVARIAAALADAAGRPSRIMIPVDLRRHDPRLRSTANLALPLFVDVAPGDGGQRVSAAMRAGLAARRELAEMDNGGLTAFPPAVVRGALRAGNLLGARTGRNLVSATVSHMGTVDLAALTAPGFTPTTMRILPQHSGIMPLLFGILETPAGLEITVSCRNGAGVEARLEALLDRIVAALEGDHSGAGTGH
ncbi:hypothetical protein AB0K56_17130, partial [Nocardia farcinica]